MWQNGSKYFTLGARFSGKSMRQFFFLAAFKDKNLQKGKIIPVLTQLFFMKFLPCNVI